MAIALNIFDQQTINQMIISASYKVIKLVNFDFPTGNCLNLTIYKEFNAHIYIPRHACSLVYLYRCSECMHYNRSATKNAGSDNHANNTNNAGWQQT